MGGFKVTIRIPPKRTAIMTENKRELEKGIALDLKDRLTYGGYLGLDTLLDSQHPLGNPAHHDEMLFIIQHQVSELWMKLIIHELGAAIEHIQHDRLSPCLKILARVKQVQRQLFEQWAVLETLTPSEYVQFRDVLGKASGFQSLQYRTIEFSMGNKHAGLLKMFEHNPEEHRQLKAVLESPSIYDEFLRFLSRAGFQIPEICVDRDWSLPYVRNDELVGVFKSIYENPEQHWSAYHMCEQLVDVEEAFQLWRFRHMKTVERTIGYKKGTGGSSGVEFLKRALDLRFFPELLDVRTEIGR
jgi:tryptophan 2,3-dioxygenase